MNAFSPDGSHDQIDPSEVDKLHLVNKEQMQANYLGEVATLRASVYKKLRDNGALENGNGWAIFTTGRLGYGAIQTHESQKETLIICRTGTRRASASEPPDLRIFEQDKHKTSYGGYALLRDVTVDFEADTQYLVTSRRFVETRAGDVFFLDGLPLYWHNEDGTIVVAADTFTNVAIAKADLPGRGPVSANLFGFFKVFEDRLHALNVAKEIVAPILNLDPVLTSTQAT